MTSKKTTYILGAGFSKSVELPDQKEMMKRFVSNAPKEIENTKLGKVENEITFHIKQFLEDAFRWKEDLDPKYELMPTLEDVFTLIDLSASEGFNLGKKYYPSKLRALRRFLIFKIFCILNREYNPTDLDKSILSRFADSLNEDTNVISLNWDIVLEKYHENLNNKYYIDYCVGNDLYGEHLDKLPIKIAKIHGSSNWVFCDNCKSMYYSTSKKIALDKLTGIYVKDIKEFYGKGESPEKIISIVRKMNNAKKCDRCKNALGTHIATFSYKKSFRTNEFMNSLKNAELMLDESEEWVFIGYSLPEADFQFKHLLKCSQLRFDKKRKISIVVKEDPASINRYKSFFGEKNISKIYNGGLAEYVNMKSNN